MARLAKDLVEKRELFMRGFMEKQKQAGQTVTLDAANEALVSHFGKGKTPKMSSGKVYEIRDSIYGKGSVKRGAPKKAAKAKATATTTEAPTTAKRGPGRPRKIEATNGGENTGLFVLKGDVKHLLALASAAGVAVALDEAATQAVTALRASA